MGNQVTTTAWMLQERAVRRFCNVIRYNNWMSGSDRIWEERYVTQDPTSSALPYPAQETGICFTGNGNVEKGLQGIWASKEVPAALACSCGAQCHIKLVCRKQVNEMNYLNGCSCINLRLSPWSWSWTRFSSIFFFSLTYPLAAVDHEMTCVHTAWNGIY